MLYEVITGNAYTPSFGLLELESLIMEQSEIGAIADSIRCDIS